jgi:hypothetical protein
MKKKLFVGNHFTAISEALRAELKTMSLDELNTVWVLADYESPAYKEIQRLIECY